MTKKARRIFSTLLSIFVICFIFSNSLQGGEVSNAKSGSVAAFFMPILNPFDLLSQDAYHFFIRKLAHFTEFAVLGVSLSALAINWEWKQRIHWIYPTVTTILVAITDETIQRFTGRTSSIKDVLLDCSGAFCGLLFIAGVYVLWKKHINRKNLK